MAITGWFVALLAIGIVPIVVTGNSAVLVLWIIFVGTLGLIDMALAASGRALRFERTSPERVRLGETTTAALRISNPTKRRLRAIVRDGWQPSAGAHRNRVPVMVPGRERREITTVLTPTRRGTRQAAHVTVRSFGPLRLIARQTTIRVPGSFTVLPPFNSRKHLPSRLARLRELDGATSVMIRGQGTEFDSLRDYVRGDDVRSIDWRATARRSELVVRTWRPERDRRVVIVVDSGRTSAARIENEPRIDTAFECALLLAALASSAGDHVDFIIYDRRVRARVHGASGPDLLSKMVNSMAPVQPELIEMDWNAVPRLVRQATTQRALVVLATPAESPGASQGLLAMLPQLTAKHTVVVASVADPTIVAASLDRSHRDAVYVAGAAERALLDQSRVAGAINQLGASVVARRPAELPLALADHYIALKAAGKL
ncbi:MAG: DUF58 domain-containing protein [Rhodoglobus sp.]